MSSLSRFPLLLLGNGVSGDFEFYRNQVSYRTLVHVKYPSLIGPAHMERNAMCFDSPNTVAAQLSHEAPRLKGAREPRHAKGTVHALDAAITPPLR